LTLLEVLISIFVLSVGLLGLASLLPVARNYMTEGAKFDRAAVLGQQALHTLESRKDLMDPTQWYAPAGNVTGFPGAFMQVCPPSPNGWWRTAVGAPVDWSLAPPSDTLNYAWPFLSPVQVIPGYPFVLDPLACSYPQNLFLNSTGGTGGGGGGTISSNIATLYGPSFFPPTAYSLDGATSGIGPNFVGSPALSRVTVPRGNQTSGAFNPPAGPPTSANPTCLLAKPMPYSVASSIFRTTDDTLFELPSDATQRPFATNGAAPASQGDYSWFAVIDNVQKPWNPGPDGAWGQAGQDDNSDNVWDNIAEAGWPQYAAPIPANPEDDVALWRTSGGELWKVWVVVVYKRNLAITEVQPGATPGTFSLTPPTGTLTYVPPERMVYCDFLTAPLPPTNAVLLNSAGQGGGDVELYVPNQITNTAVNPTAEWLNVKANQWVMLGAWPNIQSSPAANPTLPFTTPIRGQLPIVEWFRIASVGEIEQVISGGSVVGWKRKVTLDGPDFNPYKFVDAQFFPGFQQTNFQTCYCTIVDGVVGVYQATIEEGQQPTF
jgi:hypothetical protein